MLLLKEHIKVLIDKLHTLKNRRYKTLIICGPPMIGKTSLAKELCKGINGHYIDVTELLLPNIKKPGLGIFGPSEFESWMEQQFEQSDTTICFDEIEPLIATFGQKKAVYLFEILQRVESKSPVIVVTNLQNILTKATYPAERIYLLTG